jgi:hypothetical protein
VSSADNGKMLSGAVFYVGDKNGAAFDSSFCHRIESAIAAAETVVSSAIFSMFSASSSSLMKLVNHRRMMEERRKPELKCAG